MSATQTRAVAIGAPSRVRDRGETRGFSVIGVLALGFTLFLAVGLFHVWSRVAILEAGYDAVRAGREQEALREEQRALTLQLQRLRDPARLEQAAARYGLSAPAPGQIVRMKEGR